MSTWVSVAVIVGGPVVIAAGWIAVTRRSRRARPRQPELIVEWRRPLNYQIAHAFRVVELRVERFDAEALALCGTWPVAALVPVAELVTDEEAPRCAVCQHAVQRLEQRRQ